MKRFVAVALVAAATLAPVLSPGAVSPAAATTASAAAADPPVTTPTPGPADTPPPWSLTMLDGTAVGSGDLFDGALIVPGTSLTSGYLIDHDPSMNGPIDVTAETTDPAGTFESHLTITVGINGTPGQTVSLARMLRSGSIARATSALPAGQARLDITVNFDRTLTQTQMQQAIHFRFLVTASESVVSVPGSPGDPGGGGTGGGSGSSGSGTSSPLAFTGGTVSVGAMIAGAASIAFGGLLLYRRRRSRAIPPAEE